jgi:hypothetical protein
MKGASNVDFNQPDAEQVFPEPPKLKEILVKDDTQESPHRLDT